MSQSEHSRRSFLARGAAALAGAAILPQSPILASQPSAAAYKYPNPGKLVAVTDSNAVRGINQVNEANVQAMFDRAIMQFTGISASPAAALASLFPGLTAASRIAIKPNLINSSVPTRKELLKAVIRRLTEMLGGFPASNITIYERHSMSSGGYTASYFGQQVKMVVDASFPNLGYTIFCDGKDRPYSKTLYEADYLVNMPVMKDHGCSMNLTMSFKNHMGTVNPGGSLGICSNKKAVLDIMADPIMVRKQSLIVLDGLFAVINGGPGGAPGAMPCTITVSQDPVATDWYGRKTINQLRVAKGYAAHAGAYIEEASRAPYSIGVSNPSEMNITDVSLATAMDSVPAPVGWLLSDPYPNPFSGETHLQLDMTEAAHVIIEAHSIDGRHAGTLLRATLQPGMHVVPFRPASSGISPYVITARIGGAQVSRMALRI
jgi:uncharacterized protein (DUF362 family)